MAKAIACLECFTDLHHKLLKSPTQMLEREDTHGGDPLWNWRGRVTQLAVVLAGCALLVSSVEVVRLALFKYYSIDEFQYAHASWAIANGQVPYRDFFEHHFPMLYQALSAIWLFTDDHPGNIRYMRVAMIAIVALTAAAVGRLNLAKGWLAALLGPAFMLAMVPYANKATEIRPDSLGTAMFLASLAALTVDRWQPRTRGFLCGLLFMVSLWSTQKAFYFGLIYPVALLIDLVRYRSRRFLLADPLAFVAGALLVCALIAGYLTITWSWEPWFNWTILWAFIHQANYPGWGWEWIATQHIDQYRGIEFLALLGLLATLRRGERKAGPIQPNGLLIAALATSMLSYAVQKAPGGYSLVVVEAFVALFAGRGVQLAWDLAARRRFALVAQPVIILLVAQLFWNAHVSLVKHPLTITNEYQHLVFDQIDELTDPSDHAYDNSGSYVSRPHSTFFFYTDRLLRRRYRADLSNTASEGIFDSGTVLFLRDARGWISKPLKEFLKKNFQPYNGDLYLWGRKLDFSSEERVVFPAAIEGRYFVHPEGILRRGELRIDGRRITEPVFRLSQGAHTVKYSGPISQFFLLWLPRNGERYVPRWDLPRRFSRIY